jgi:hypothetical protein
MEKHTFRHRMEKLTILHFWFYAMEGKEDAPHTPSGSDDEDTCSEQHTNGDSETNEDEEGGNFEEDEETDVDRDENEE